MFDAEHSLLVKFSLTAQITRVICTGKMKGCRADIYGWFAKILCTLMRCFWLVVKCAKLPPVTNLHFERKKPSRFIHSVWKITVMVMVALRLIKISARGRVFRLSRVWNARAMKQIQIFVIRCLDDDWIESYQITWSVSRLVSIFVN